LGVHALLTFLPKHLTRSERHEHAMKLDLTNFQAVAASLTVEGEACDLPNAKLWLQAADAEIAPLIQKLGAASFTEIERLIVELREAQDHLQSENERIERETVRYVNLTQMASTTAKIISDAISQWHPARNQQKSTTSEAVAASPEDDDTGIKTSGHHGAGHDAADAAHGSSIV
jgi:hypothetical protein